MHRTKRYLNGQVQLTPDNSNLPLIRSSFCFPSDHFYIILPSITRTLEKAVYWSPKHGVYFKTSVSILCLYYFVTPVQTHCPSLYILIKLCWSIPFFFFQNINLYLLLPLKDLEVRGAWYLHSRPIHLLISLLLNTWFVRTPFDFPSRFELSGEVDCVIFKYPLYIFKCNFWHGQGWRNPSTPMEGTP